MPVAVAGQLGLIKRPIPRQHQGRLIVEHLPLAAEGLVAKELLTLPVVWLQIPSEMLGTPEERGGIFILATANVEV